MTVSSGNDGNNNLFGQVKKKLNRKWGDSSGTRTSPMASPDGGEKKKKKKYLAWTRVRCCCWRTSGDVAESTVFAPVHGETGNGCLHLFGGNEEKRKISDQVDDPLTGVGKLSGSNGTDNGFSGMPPFLPSIHSSQPDLNFARQTKATVQNKFDDVDEIKLQETMTQLSGLLTNSRVVAKSAPKDSHPGPNSPGQGSHLSNGLPEESDTCQEVKGQKSLERTQRVKGHEALPTAVASAPAVISTEVRGQTPSTSSSNSTDFGTLSGSEVRIRRLAGAADITCRNHTAKQKTHKALLGSKSGNKVGIAGDTFPENLKPFDRPKEGLDTCFSQLESQQWEVNMLGLTSLVRLLRHHPAVVLGQLHPIVVALSRQVKNLRSQVARASCQASAEMFLVLKRNVEPDLDELSGPLFHRSADTNRFIRADCNDALDNMVDSVGHAKAVSVIISKGTTHQNATVRAVAARLLLRLSDRVGPEKLLSLPKEIRDKMLQAGANLLTEGKLETRAFAKQVFRSWSSHPTFSALILEAIPPNVMRQINKTLAALKPA